MGSISLYKANILICGGGIIGPTAIPVFGKENYGIIKNLNKEVFDILYRDISLFISNSKFRKAALTEANIYIFKNYFKDIKIW